MRSRLRSDELIVTELPEIVLGQGEHTFRVIFSPKKHKNCHDLEVKVLNPGSSLVPTRVERWGTKMKVFMTFPVDALEGVHQVVVEGPGLDGPVAKFWYVR